MSAYAVVASTVSSPMRVTVHAAKCRCVAAARSRREPVMSVEADTASQAAATYSEKCQLKERGLPEPEVCECAK